MGTSNYSDEFKRDAVHQIKVRGYPVREVSQGLGVSTYSLYKWLKLFGEPRDMRPEVARVVCAFAFPYDGERLARIARSDDVHCAAPRSAVEAGNVVPDKRLRCQLVFAHGFNLPVRHCHLHCCSKGERCGQIGPRTDTPATYGGPNLLVGPPYVVWGLSLVVLKSV